MEDEHWSIVHRAAEYEFAVRSAATSRWPPKISESVITFEFSCTPFFSRAYCGIDSEPVFYSELCPKLRAIFSLNLEQLFSYETVEKIITEKLRHWPVWDVYRVELIHYAWKSSWHVVLSMPENHNRVFLDIDVGVGHYEIAEPGQLTMDDYEPRMVPADESAIEALEKGEISTSATCTVCLEDLVQGGEGVFMPCKHVFHQDCIEEWLEVSHYCPLCRFQMPPRLD